MANLGAKIFAIGFLVLFYGYANLSSYKTEWKAHRAWSQIYMYQGIFVDPADTLFHEFSNFKSFRDSCEQFAFYPLEEDKNSLNLNWIVSFIFYPTVVNILESGEIATADKRCVILQTNKPVAGGSILSEFPRYSLWKLRDSVSELGKE